MEQEFFVPARTLIVVNLIKQLVIDLHCCC